MKHIAIVEDISPNLVPMIDIMFLLLLFFMLSADMGQSELEEVRLPDARSADPDDPPASGAPRLTINGFHRSERELNCAAYSAKDPKRICGDRGHWGIGIRGRTYSLPADHGALEGRLAEEAGASRTSLSERKVMIRVDSNAPFGLAQQVMNLCAKVGLYKVEVGAALPPEPR